MANVTSHLVKATPEVFLGHLIGYEDRSYCLKGPPITCMIYSYYQKHMSIDQELSLTGLSSCFITKAK